MILLSDGTVIQQKQILVGTFSFYEDCNESGENLNASITFTSTSFIQMLNISEMSFNTSTSSQGHLLESFRKS